MEGANTDRNARIRETILGVLTERDRGNPMDCSIYYCHKVFSRRSSAERSLPGEIPARVYGGCQSEDLSCAECKHVLADSITGESHLASAISETIEEATDRRRAAEFIASITNTAEDGNG